MIIIYQIVSILSNFELKGDLKITFSIRAYYSKHSPEMGFLMGETCLMEGGPGVNPPGTFSVPHLETPRKVKEEVGE